MSKQRIVPTYPYGPYYIPDKWCVSFYNFIDEVREDFDLPKKVILRDSTLREGDEQPGTTGLMKPENKLRVAEKIAEAGVTFMELGYPGVVKEHFEAIKLIKKEIPQLRISAFARAWDPDWKKDVDMCVEAGADVVDVLDYASSIHLTLYGCTRDEVIERDIAAIEYAKQFNVDVGFGPIHAPQVEWEFLRRLYLLGERLGVSYITVYEDGIAAPPTIRHIIKEAKKLVDVPLLSHCHNDFGMAVANSITAIAAGAEMSEVIVNGMGDKSGCTSFEELVMGLEALYGVDTGIDLSKLYGLSQFVEEVSGIRCQPHKAVTGENMFLHEADMHTTMILRNSWESIEPYRADLVGHKSSVVFGDTTLQGEAIRAGLDKLELEYTEETVDSIRTELRKRLTKKIAVSWEEFQEIAKTIA